MNDLNHVKECPDCAGETRVLNVRTRPDGSLWRRRGCLQCGFRFDTIEIEEFMPVDNARAEIMRLQDHIERLEDYIRKIKDVVNTKF